jgi:sigma-E factor negative regulatory protein RseB
MKKLFFVLVCFFSSWACAQEGVSAKQLLTNLADAVHSRNFDASFVVMKGKAMEPYRWLHGNQQGIEVEFLSLLNGAGLEMVRVGDQVTYYEPQAEPYAIKTDSIAGPIPEVLFKDISILEQHYDFVLGGKGRIAGRAAQLVRIESKDNSKYN